MHIIRKDLPGSNELLLGPPLLNGGANFLNEKPVEHTIYNFLI
jgi:hypothetical protein